MEQLDSQPGPPLPPPRRGDQIVVLHDVPWEQYDALCRASEDSAGPRMAYLDGELEIMSPGGPHEFEKKLIARLIEAYAEESELPLNGHGSQTFRKKAKQAGVEPDECYFLGAAGLVPDVAIEVEKTSGGIEKLEIYRRLKVPEVWFWIRGRFWVYGLAGRRYRELERSTLFPALDLAKIAEIVLDSAESHQTEAVRAYRKKLRARR